MSLNPNKLQNLIDSYYIKNIKLYNMIKEVKEKKLFKILIETDADMNVKDKNGNIPLHRITSIDVMKIFVCAGANPNIQNNNGDTPLHLSKDIEITNILLCAGADPEIKNNNGDIPLLKIKDSFIFTRLNQYK